MNDAVKKLLRRKAFWLAAIGVLAAYGILAPDQANAVRGILDALAGILEDSGILIVPPTPTPGA